VYNLPSAGGGPAGRERHIFCKKCGYPLWAVTTGACPECGRAFAPSDPRTYLDKWAPLRRSALAHAQLLLAIWPVLFLAFAYGSALAAHARLGRWPRWPEDHTQWKAISPNLISLGNSCCCTLPIATLAAFIVTGAMFIPARRQGLLLWWCWRVALALACWAAVCALMRWDPGRILLSFTWDTFS
jgi:ribosomal protein L37E